MGKILEMAAKKGLPPIAWTVQTVGATLAGQVLTYQAADCRAHFAAWRSAIIAASGQAPDHGREHALGDATRLMAGWERVPVTLAPSGGLPPRVHVTLSATLSAPHDPEEDPDA